MPLRLRIHRHLLPPPRHRIRKERNIAPQHQQSLLTLTESARFPDRIGTHQLPLDDTTIALVRPQRERLATCGILVIHLCCQKLGARPADIPRPAADDTTVSFSVVGVHVQDALASERRAGTGGRWSCSPRRSLGWVPASATAAATTTAALWRISDSHLRTRSLPTVRDTRHELPRLHAAPDVEVVPHLIELCPFTSQADVGAVTDTERSLDLLKSVSFRGGWQDARFGEPGVGRELLVDSDSGAEVVYDFFLRPVVRAVAGGCQSADAGSVLLPFMPPEVLVVALVVLWRVSDVVGEGRGV
jgi:hypothetical protein